MKKIITLLATCALLALSCVDAQPAGAQTAEDNAGAVVCAPDVYLEPPADCLPLGPSEYLTEMARLGMSLPLQPLYYNQPDPGLRALPYMYYKVNADTGTQFYPSLGAAQDKSGANRILPTGHLLYVVYDERDDTKHGTYFLLPSGEWMPGDGSTVSVPEVQPGLEFDSTPSNGFGWVLEPETPVRAAPNTLPSNRPTRTLTLYSVVQVYSLQNIEGQDWFLIGPNEWVPAERIAAYFPDSTPPAGVSNGRWIDVNLGQETLGVYENNRLVFATVITTGTPPFWTRPGLFQIYKKKELETMSGFQGDALNYYYLENVPWTMYFDKARALHGAYWRTRFGYEASHGCVNLSIGDAHWLFNWAKEGDWVYVHDPSGRTPTNPASYTDGGA